MRLRALALVLVLALSAGALHAQIPEGMEGEPFRPHPEADRAISQLYSPYCPGFMLGVCSAPESAALRDSIQALAYQGWSSGELVEWMLANHGEEYRAVPLRRGWGVWAWILPPLGLAVGVLLVIGFLRRAAARKPESEPDAAPVGPKLTSAEESRLREAIRDLELSEDPSF